MSTSKRISVRAPSRGSALLAVMWLSVALSAIAFSVATNVRTETARASTTTDGVRAYYVAAGAIDRAILWIFWGLYNNYSKPDGSPLYYRPPMPLLAFNFPNGFANVEVIPETSKLNVNLASPEDLDRLLQAHGVDAFRSQQLAAGIVAWRSFSDSAGGPAQFGPSRGPGQTFQAPHASLQELEEILLIPGMTPELFYGHYDHDLSGGLIPRSGLRDSLTVWGSASGLDVNTVPPAVLQSLPMPIQAVEALVLQRARAPFSKIEDVAKIVQDPAILAKLRIGGNSIWTLRATAHVRTPSGKISDLRRSVSAVVKFLDAGQFNPPYHILRWYDDAYSPGL